MILSEIANKIAHIKVLMICYLGIVNYWWTMMEDALQQSFSAWGVLWLRWWWLVHVLPILIWKTTVSVSSLVFVLRCHFALRNKNISWFLDNFNIWKHLPTANSHTKNNNNPGDDSLNTTINHWHKICLRRMCSKNT